MSVCMRYSACEDDAVQLLNFGFLKILNNLNKYQTEKPFEAWIKRIMINTIIDEYRKNYKYKNQIKTEDPENMPEIEINIALNDGELKLLANDLEQYIQGLPPMSREVFNLFAIDGYSHKEISGMLQISVGTSKWHVSQARQTLKSFIQKALNTIRILL